jgi:prevent-host-death family protein
MTWAATQAKAKFSEVLDRAETAGPQLVKRRKQEFLVITREDFAERTGGSSAAKAGSSNALAPGESVQAKSQNLAEFFRNSPLRDSGIDLERVKLRPRHVAF